MKNKDALYLNNNFLHGNEIFFGLSKINEHYPLHFHEFYEIEIPIEGEGYEIINGVKENIAFNKVFLFHPTDYHEIYATKPLILVNIAFTNTIIDEEIISNFLNYDTCIIIELTEHKTKQINATIQVIKEIYNSNRTNKDLILMHLVNALLLIIIGGNTVENKQCSKTPSTNILKYIHENFSKNPSLQELSDYCGYQKNYFCEYFKRLTGVTYKEYLSEVKINYSKKLLKISSKSIKEIAEECGFNSANNYIRKFKETTKITPKQYRKLYLDTKS